MTNKRKFNSRKHESDSRSGSFACDVGRVKDG